MTDKPEDRGWSRGRAARTGNASANILIRVSPEDKEMLNRAALIERRSLSSFMLVASLAKAREIIKGARDDDAT